MFFLLQSVQTKTNPKVYLQVVPESPRFKLQESEVAAVQCKVYYMYNQF